MPIVHLTAPDHVTHTQLKLLGDEVHRALVEAVGIPEGDRFQLMVRRASETFSFDAHHLDVERQHVVCVEITLVGGRTDAVKRDLYQRIAAGFTTVGIRPEDVFVVLTENGRADWSVGNGDAQLLDLAAAPSTAG